MPSIELTTEWQEATGPLGMADGTSYLVEFHGDKRTVVQAIAVNGTTRPDNDAIDWFAYHNRDTNNHVLPTSFTKDAGFTWWARIGNSGSSTMVSGTL